MSEKTDGNGRYTCPRCGRNVLATRLACIYCGEPAPRDTTPCLPQSLVAEAPLAVVSRRALIIVDLSNVSAEQAARALDLGLADASLRTRRGGYQLQRIVSLDESESCVARLRHNGVAAWSLSADRIEAGRHPVIVRGGDVAAGRFVLAENSAPIQVASENLLIALWGRIRRERHEPPGPERLRYRPSPSSLEEEHCIHLHRRLEVRPLEIDPGAFEFAEQETALESSLLRIRSGLESLMNHRTIDDSFRFETPVMTPMQARHVGIFAIVESLKDRFPEPRDRAPERLHNLNQFRFYSAWRGALAHVLESD
ncbi:MAG: hypothetical protein JXO72_00900 [Vicinamibacteria bacterium]|nr:hypothetical protein [Vicinamibacteria bacterium]